MTVYIVVHNSYDGVDILGVYASDKDAMAAYPGRWKNDEGWVHKGSLTIDAHVVVEETQP